MTRGDVKKVYRNTLISIDKKINKYFVRAQKRFTDFFQNCLVATDQIYVRNSNLRIYILYIQL